MRYTEFRILVEYDRSKTIATLGPGIEKRAASDTYLKSQGGDPVAAVVAAAEEADPTANKQYVVWIVRQYVKNGLKYEDIYKLHNDLDVFSKTKGQHKRLGVNSDIGQYTWKTLYPVVQKLSSTELSAPEEPATAKIEGVKTLYDGPLGTLSVPETEAASCELGRGTRWCTAAQNRNMFSYYTKDGPLYVWFDRKEKAKYQFHFESFQFMDAQDRPIDAGQLNYFAFEHPVLKKLFASKKEAIAKGMNEYVDYLEQKRDYEYDPSDWEEQELSPPQNDQYDELEPREMFLLVGKENLDQHLKSIKKIPVLAYNYAAHILGKPWPEGEKAILEDDYYIVAYATDVIKGRWPEGEKRLLSRVYHNTSKYMLIRYAINVIKGPWPEAEERAKYSPEFVYLYSKDVLKKRWPEAEPYLAKVNYNNHYVSSYMKEFGIEVDDLNATDEQKARLKTFIKQ
jgi:hypothetical protein